MQPQCVFNAGIQQVKKGTLPQGFLKGPWHSQTLEINENIFEQVSFHDQTVLPEV